MIVKEGLNFLELQNYTDKNFCLGQPPYHGPVHPLSQPPLDPQPLGAPGGQQKKGWPNYEHLETRMVENFSVHSWRELFRFCVEDRGEWAFGNFSFSKALFPTKAHLNVHSKVVCGLKFFVRFANLPKM